MTSKTTNKFSPEVRARAVRMVLDHEHEHARVGRRCVDCGQDRLHGADAASMGRQGRARQRAQAWPDHGRWPPRLKTLERENRELRQANEILRKASAYFDGVDAPARRHCNVSLADPLRATRRSDIHASSCDYRR